ncbi:hypothetical protein [Methanosarcina sp.]|uniref:hypothetical protein n=1 Tax=Methanosarcina sp. TaxID=2213 RepID=UPI003C771DA1
MRSVCTNKAGTSKPFHALELQGTIQAFVYPVPAIWVLRGNPDPSGPAANKTRE